MEITKELALFLARSGLGTFDETGTTGNIFIETIPNKPDEAIAIFSTGGTAADPKNEYVKGSYQILIRTIRDDPRAGSTTAQQIIDLLNGFNSDYLTAGGHWIFDCQSIQTIPSNIGRDENNRFEFSQNFYIEYKR